jgi:hypothetical protein
MICDRVVKEMVDFWSSHLGGFCLIGGALYYQFCGWCCKKRARGDDVRWGVADDAAARAASRETAHFFSSSIAILIFKLWKGTLFFRTNSSFRYSTAISLLTLANPAAKMATTATRGSAALGTKNKPTYPPNSTLYITNLPSSKIQKDDLRRALYMLFSTYGSVLDIVAMRTMKMRGQAHVTYKDVQTATQAMRALQKFEFFGREMVSFLRTCQQL